MRVRAAQGVTAAVHNASSGIVNAAAAAGSHPYDLGPVANLEQIFGSPAHVLIPPLAPTPGGTSYPTVWDYESGKGEDAGAFALG